MRKIIHIITRLDMGGSAQNTLRSCMGLSGNKYQIVLVHGLSHESNMTADERRIVSRDVEIAEQKGVRVLPLAFLIKRIEPVQDFLAFISLLKLMVQEKPDAVHTHSSKAGLLGRWAAWLARVPVILHTPHGHVFYGHFPDSVSKLFLLIEKFTDGITDCTIALTDGERKDYIKLLVSGDAKLTTIHSGVDVETFMNPVIDLKEKRKSLNIKPGDRVVGTVGWLLPIKGPVYLLKAMPQVWQKNPDVKLVFVGKGELESELKAVADDMGARDRVLFLGWRDDVHEVMSVFDIFVLPSLNEGMGRVIVEAMAAGKPVVASKTGGIPDLVIDGETGILVEPGDSEGLAEAINHLLKSPDLRQTMGQEGRKRCHLFSEKLMIEKIDKLYQRLLNC